MGVGRRPSISRLGDSPVLKRTDAREYELDAQAEISWIDVNCLTASRRRLRFGSAVASGLPLNEMRYHGSNFKACTCNDP